MLNQEYDVLGFDADHCLVKYNISALVRLMIATMSEDLREIGYPAEIQQFDTERL